MKIIVPLVILFFNLQLFAQDVDSLKLVDSLFTSLNDSLNVVDSLKSKKSDVDTIIYVSSEDSLIFNVKNKKMNIYGNGELKYKETDLKSASMLVDFNTSTIEAIGVESDSAEGKYDGTPVLVEKGETYEGFRMKYNFKTQQGFISSAGTEDDGTKYSGAKIKKMDKETYFIEDGIYTTCTEDCPHYHFSAKHMKVINKEQIIAEWIWINFGGVPFPVPIPFAVFPIEKGRRSGIIPPAFGDDGTYGRYFSRFGYFWAISDYMDLNLTADYYTRGSYNLNSRFRYAQRYSYTGNLETGYSFFKTGESTDENKDERTDWRIRWNHNQSITPTLRFDANLEFISGNYLRRNVTDFNELLRNDIFSNATVFKSWEESGISLSGSYSRTQSLESGNINEVLPSISFSKSQMYPFQRKGGSGEKKWYETFGVSYNSQLQNNRVKTDGDLRIRGGIQHNISTSFAPKIGYFSFTPSFRYQEKWYNKMVEKSVTGIDTAGRDVVTTDDVYKINMVRTFGLGLSASTKIYGMFQPNSLGVSAIRHTISPTISYNYTPDFSTPFWDYYSSYVNSKGEEVKYSKFEREIFGGASNQEQQNISFSVSNIFEMKTAVDPTDTTSRENKIQLLNLNASVGYNFAADSLKFSDISLNYRTQIGQYLSFSGSSTYTLYDYSEESNRINKFLINQGKGLLRLTNFNFSISTSLSGDRLTSGDGSDYVPQQQNDQYQLGNTGNVYQGIYNEKDADFSIPWDISLNYNYSVNKPTPLKMTKFSGLSGSVNFNITKNWKFSFAGSYDLERKEFAAPQIKISRDLHCWLMNFTWQPLGIYRGYRFEIRVKAPQLQDLKVTKRDEFFDGR
ncbi:MAG: LPS-assembly protein LptD [Ignavibacteriales bacterium]|nr:MAG: LPS-assembly protein LptD [Ignavibacteriales bacterium]